MRRRVRWNNYQLGLISRRLKEVLKDDNAVDQAYTLQPGANEIWRLQDDLATYTRNPIGAAPIGLGG